jgi:hypothetical protein
MSHSLDVDVLNEAPRAALRPQSQTSQPAVLLRQVSPALLVGVTCVDFAATLKIRGSFILTLLSNLFRRCTAAQPFSDEEEEQVPDREPATEDNDDLEPDVADEDEEEEGEELIGDGMEE